LIVTLSTGSMNIKMLSTFLLGSSSAMMKRISWTISRALSSRPSSNIFHLPDSFLAIVSRSVAEARLHPTSHSSRNSSSDEKRGTLGKPSILAAAGCFAACATCEAAAAISQARPQLRGVETQPATKSGGVRRPRGHPNPEPKHTHSRRER
jgi:hypothetical protein